MAYGGSLWNCASTSILAILGQAGNWKTWNMDNNVNVKRCLLPPAGQLTA